MEKDILAKQKMFNCENVLNQIKSNFHPSERKCFARSFINIIELDIETQRMRASTLQIFSVNKMMKRIKRIKRVLTNF